MTEEELFKTGKIHSKKFTKQAPKASFHMTEAGPRICRASKRACPLGESVAHYDDYAVALQIWEDTMVESYGAFPDSEADDFEVFENFLVPIDEDYANAGKKIFNAMTDPGRSANYTMLKGLKLADVELHNIAHTFDSLPEEDRAEIVQLQAELAAEEGKRASNPKLIMEKKEAIRLVAKRSIKTWARSYLSLLERAKNHNEDLAELFETQAAELSKEEAFFRAYVADVKLPEPIAREFELVWNGGPDVMGSKAYFERAIEVYVEREEKFSNPKLTEAEKESLMQQWGFANEAVVIPSLKFSAKAAREHLASRGRKYKPTVKAVIEKFDM